MSNETYVELLGSNHIGCYSFYFQTTNSLHTNDTVVAKITHTDTDNFELLCAEFRNYISLIEHVRYVVLIGKDYTVRMFDLYPTGPSKKRYKV
jgi:hypothetical protein